MILRICRTTFVSKTFGGFNDFSYFYVGRMGGKKTSSVRKGKARQITQEIHERIEKESEKKPSSAYNLLVFK